MTANRETNPVWRTWVKLALVALVIGLGAFGLFLAYTLGSFGLWVYRAKNPPVYEWHNKYTVTVDTPQGQVSANSVLAQKLFDRRKSPQLGSGNVWEMYLRGEAVALNAGKTPDSSGYLFVLAVSEGNKYLPFKVFRKYFNQPDASYADIAKRLDENQGPVTLERGEYPMLVTFTDINDPASVKRVDPNDMDASFGLCPDGSGLHDEDAPWRKEGKSWYQWWKNNEALQSVYEERISQLMLAAREEAVRLVVASLKLPPDTEGPVLKYYLGSNLEQYRLPEEQRLAILNSHVGELSVDQKASLRKGIEKTYYHLYKQKLDALKKTIVRDTSSDCYQLKSITFEITDEPVTTDRVESVLGWYSKGQEIPNDIWRNALTSEQRKILSSVNWIKE